ncbi:sugar O-acetyltransferase [Oricola cellulosilytica]|uniref:Nodulation protein L n=1 Tax=Oricola cellulosilytica TaxID=1429082 RepID=A0A4V2MP29_9HYPH|nr:sugar O-acetyltransferase [Oricola cellulosilytica]TCD15942.1 sugar O-acetyltransferase [Oricola cellulosilytica]
MAKTEREKMEAGEWYSCIDPELESLRTRARAAIHEHNTMAPGRRGNIGPALAGLLGAAPADVVIETPFHCPYGFNIFLGAGVFLNAGCIILDTAKVRMGARTMLGPGVQIYCAEHHLDPVKRREGLEVARPVTIGEDVWIGGGAIVLPGVAIGDRSIVGAGSVVTKDVAPETTVVGNPARYVSRQ